MEVGNTLSYVYPVSHDILDKYLNKLLTADGQLVVSLVLGYNPEMDRLLIKGVLGFDKKFYSKRISEFDWKEVRYEEIKDVKYDESVTTSTVIVICMSSKK